MTSVVEVPLHVLVHIQLKDPSTTSVQLDVCLHDIEEVFGKGLKITPKKLETVSELGHIAPKIFAFEIYDDKNMLHDSNSILDKCASFFDKVGGIYKIWITIKNENPITIVMSEDPNIILDSIQRPILEKHIKSLEAKLSTLTGKLNEPALFKESKSPDDLICDEIEKNLGKEFIGKIIAIDMEKKEMVGYGQSIGEAYDMALKNSKEKQFDFRRVGFEALESL